MLLPLYKWTRNWKKRIHPFSKRRNGQVISPLLLPFPLSRCGSRYKILPFVFLSVTGSPVNLRAFRLIHFVCISQSSLSRRQRHRTPRCASTTLFPCPRSLAKGLAKTITRTTFSKYSLLVPLIPNAFANSHVTRKRVTAYAHFEPFSRQKFLEQGRTCTTLLTIIYL